MRRALALAAVLGALAAPVLTARAGGTIAANVADHILTVTGTAEGDGITVGCEDGSVTVNRNQPDGGPEACAELERILVFAEGGSDRVSLGEVGPVAFGRLEVVIVAGEAGDDTLIGSGIGDELRGGAGIDVLRGGGGADELLPGLGSGEAIGGKGRDEVSVTGDADWSVNDERIARTTSGEEIALGSIEVVQVTGGRSANTISTGSFTGHVIAFGQGGDDLVATGAKADHLDGGDGNDYMDAGSGDDLLEGGRGSDALRGGFGDDVLRGGPGDDACTGGPGADAELSC
jgi:Ca2+-binding RTX toxin-like protein